MNIIQLPSPDEFNRSLADMIYTIIDKELQHSRPGHCLRVSTLPETIMRDLCERFNASLPAVDVVLLLGPHQVANFVWEVSAPQLVALRNAEARPLLTFVPPGLKAAAEDSFDVSTFVDVNLADVSGRLRNQLLLQLPEQLRGLTVRAIQYLDKQEHLVTDEDIIRYYITLLKNGSTAAAAGGAVFQLNLVPDFALFDVVGHIEQRLARNAAAIRTLTENSRPLIGRIHALQLKAKTIQSELLNFLREYRLADVKTWGRLIAGNSNYRHLAFEQWLFEGEVVDRDQIIISVDDPDLPARAEDLSDGLKELRYFDVKRAASVRLRWETDPKPSAVGDLAYFRIEIVSTDGAIAWESGNIAKSHGSKAAQSKTLKTADFRDRIEDGLYFFRVRAYTEGGDLISEENAEEHPLILRDPRNLQGRRKYETEDIWFWIDPNETPPPPEPLRNLNVNSYLDAQLHVWQAAIKRGDNPFADALTPRHDKTGWVASKGQRTESIYNIVYDAQTRFTLPVSNPLRFIESNTLSHPETLGRWRVNFTDAQALDAVQPVLRQYRADDAVPAEFLEARRLLFEAIRCEVGDCITATVDLANFADLIIAYCDAYGKWLTQVQVDFGAFAVRGEDKRRRTDPLFLDLDSVEVILPGDGHIPDRVYLLAPTHPLRLLWHLQRARVARQWIQTAIDRGQPEELLTPQIWRYLFSGFVPMNLPPVLRTTHETFPEGISRFYVEQGPVTPFWGLYVREDARDSRELRARLQRALRLSRQSIDVNSLGSIDKDVLAQKMSRYLVQHPYAQTLKINAFNPGDAGVIVDAILALEKERTKQRLPALRYELRLFTHGTRPDDIGDAVDELLNPERQVSPEADAFAVPSQNHLFPKLRFSRNQLSDFVASPDQFEAHISILHDLFPISVDLEALQAGRSSFVYGLVQEQTTQFTGYETDYAWQRQLLPRMCHEPDGSAPGISARLATLLSQIANLQASVAAGTKVESVIPSLRLRLDNDAKRLLYQIHAVTDWVFIIDRHLGLEYFDSDSGDDRAVYLLDFTPEFGGTDTDRLLLTTRSIEEVVRLTRPVLNERDLLIGDGIEVYFLQLLRSLSGRLALKLLSSPNSASEALGLAMARLFLEQYELLNDRIVLPLDAHSALFADSESAPTDYESSLKRSDLLVVTCQPETRSIHFHVIEVKWRSDLRDFTAYVTLRQEIEKQLMRSEQVLRYHFDPHLQTTDRIDRQIKTKELISLLNFYLSRSQRYGLLSAQTAAAVRPFIESLDEGYHLTTASAGLIFDFSVEGLTQDEEHAGLVFHRVGRDYIRRLLDNGLRQRSLLQEQARVTASSIEEAEQQQEKRQRVVRDTDMSGDASYHRVRTHFPRTNLPSSRNEPPLSAVTQLVQVEQDQQVDVAPAITDENENPASMIDSQPPLAVLEHDGEQVRPEHEPSAIEILPPSYDVLIGETNESRQYGILGRAAGKIVALDLNSTNTISLFGVQGGGKSYTLGTIVEMATQSFDGINVLPSPLASVIFHYHESQDYPPEFVSMREPNSAESEVRVLEQEFHARPARLEDVVILTSADKLSVRRAEYPSVRVEPIYFSSSELSFKDWRFLMGVGGNQMYMKQINFFMRQLRENMTLETLRHEIEGSELSDMQKAIARLRLNFAAQFIDDSRRLADVLRPGRLIIVDLRDEFIDKDEALGLFVVMLNIFANARRSEGFNKLIVFDEAHKYMDNPELTGYIVDVIRQMRHQGVSVLIASQDPPSLPNAIIELSSVIILHRFNSPQWLKHVQRSITALSDLTPAQLAALSAGDAYIWATKSTERALMQKAVKMRLRPRITQHGGETKTAV